MSGGVEPPPAPPTQIVIVGHVDHGKSSVIGRLLHDSGNLATGRIEAAQASSARRGLDLEWSHLLDSLQAERDQGVTIDATRLPFRLQGRGFVIVDAPGHRQFMRNMLTGAADARAAVLVIDIAAGVQEQTRRHAMLLRLIGLRHVIVLLNKADQLGYDPARIAAASGRVATALSAIGLMPACMVPASARDGVNILAPGTMHGLTGGPTLAEALLAVPVAAPPLSRPARLSVQDVYRLGEDRIVVGRLASGRLRVGDRLALGTTGAVASIARFAAWPGPVPEAAEAGQSVALVLEPQSVLARGDLLHAPEHRPLLGRRLRAHLFWLRATSLELGETLSLRLACFETAVTVTRIDEVVDVGGDQTPPAGTVPPEGFAAVELLAASPVPFDAFAPGETGGRGVLADRAGHIVAAAPLDGLAEPGLPDPTDAVPLVCWLTGLPGAGKSTIAAAAAAALRARGQRVVVLDGDVLRQGLNGDLGFSPADRTENVRRTAHVARLLADSGAVVLVALISPLVVQRQLARDIVGPGFREVYVAADVQTCAGRDPKGHYAAARAGSLPGYTGIDGSYEPPPQPDLRLDTATVTPPESCAILLDHIARHTGRTA